MSSSLFSVSWYRVADIRPQLRAHSQTHRQVFRNEIWYVLQDRQSGQFHRLSPMANLMLCLMDGRRNVQDIWDAAGRKSPEAPPTQDETIQFLSYLHSSDLLQTELPPDFDEMAQRAERANRRRMAQQIRNPMAVRLPIFDPDRLLAAMLPFVRPLFSLPGFLAWLALVIYAVSLAVIHWPELNADVIDRILVTENVALMAAIYPLIKSLHELGHAFACKVWGGAVHEVGIMLLIFIPVLYVDASASAAFASKRRRIIVSAAGMLVEAALAAVAMIVWVNASPGIGRSVAFDVMLIGGVSTLLFNGNPLLRFDGYYILSDWLEIPNLGTRSSRYFQFVFKKWCLWIDDLTPVRTAPGEAGWLLAYAVLSWLYRLLVSFGIAAFLATKFFVFGLLLAMWSLVSVVVTPLFKGIQYLGASPQLRGQHRRVYFIAGALAALTVIGLFMVPLPYSTHANGVVVYPDRAETRARTAGFLQEILAAPGSAVETGQPLIAFADPILDAQITVLRAELDESRARLAAIQDVDRVQTQMFAGQIENLQKRVDTFEKRKIDLTVVANHPGRFVLPRQEDLPGRYYRRDELIGFVIGEDDPVIQMLMPQSEIDLIGKAGVKVEVRLADDMEQPFEAQIRREVPAAQQDIPNLALTTRGGGDITLDPSRSQKPEALFSYFLVEVAPQKHQRLTFLGAHAAVRFSLPGEPLAFRMIRTVRQFIIGQFRV